ncbi:alanine racemase [Pantoea coffeiphila]|uniref:alanine racemase n=1 Tax=Pantoea coffeiphila TaxID=1465635 RepID=UPI001960998F|nr:alanine racemase [Pantoea coffeiphila]MBM7345033.1 alanine racemase [Pantoea coffeiphila]
MPRPIYAEINTANIKSNFEIIRGVNSGQKMWSVVKANAYGHGISNIWRHLNSTDGFALLDLNEALLLRKEGWTGKILLLEGFFEHTDLEIIDEHQLTFAVHSDWQIDALRNYHFANKVDVYLKVNSGMNRLGFTPFEIGNVLNKLRRIPYINSVTLMSHFANADTREGVIEPMMTIDNLHTPENVEHCLANSAALLWHRDTHRNWVRPGIILYGASPSGNWADIADTGLKPVMSLKSKIIAIQHLKKGDAVGYGGNFRATNNQTIGVVACGYADGYFRTSREGTPVLVDGVRTGLVGRVSMDMLTVDLTSCPSACINSDVELWGEHLPVDVVANAAGTIGYELLTALAPRVTVRVI